jgi:protein-S-isoprenylcysteine O-methyltransferase Ste14
MKRIRIPIRWVFIFVAGVATLFFGGHLFESNTNALNGIFRPSPFSLSSTLLSLGVILLGFGLFIALIFGGLIFRNIHTDKVKRVSIHYASWAVDISIIFAYCAAFSATLTDRGLSLVTGVIALSSVMFYFLHTGENFRKFFDERRRQHMKSKPYQHPKHYRHRNNQPSSPRSSNRIG